MLSKVTLIGGLAAVAMAGSAHAGLLYSNDFDGAELRGAGVSGAFSGLPTEAAAAGFWNAAGWAGNYGASRGGLVGGSDVADFTGLSLTGLATHTHINASFILGFLESWDSTDGGPPFSPDHLEIFIDGAKVADLTYNNALGTVKMIGGGTLLTDGMGHTSEYVQANDNLYFSDTLVDMGTAPFLSFAHTGSTLDLLFRATGAGWQGGGDEGYGLDNVVLTYDGIVAPPGGVPEPASWALMLAGFGLSGSALRRRRQAVAG